MRSTQGNIVRLLSIILVMVQMAGCQSMRTIEDSPESVPSGIENGALLEEGDWVRLYLTSGESIYLQFERVRNGQIIGHQHAKPESDTTEDASTYWTEVKVPISEIERVERGEFSAGKTAAAVGMSALWVLILFAIAFASLMSGG